MSSSAMDKAALVAQFETLLSDYASTTAPGLVIGVSLEGESIYRRAVGMASLEHAVANTPQTRMRIGSTSKQFTAVALLHLAEAGLLNLDDGVDQYYPELPELEGYPTLRQLLNHTSGYRDVQEIALNAAGLAVQPAGLILRALEKQSSVIFAPGDGQIYCNAGYYVISEVISRVSSLSFASYLEQHIFHPLGMSDTALLESDMQIAPRMATLHMPPIDGVYRRGILVNEETSGCGGIISTIDDLLIWGGVLLAQDKLLSADGWKQILAPTQLNSGVCTGYGLGIYRHPIRGVDMIHHAGGVIGGNSQLLVVPEHGLCIAAMSNAHHISAAAVAMQVVEAVLGEHLEAPTAPPPSAGYEHLFGKRYHHKQGLVIGFNDVAGLLGISAQFSPAAPILKAEEEQFVARWEDIGMGPFAFRHDAMQPDADGAAPATLTILEGGISKDFRLIVENTETLNEHELEGEYYSDDMDTWATISLDESTLSMEFVGRYGHRQMAMTPISHEVLDCVSLDPMAPVRYPVTLRRVGDQVTGFHICNTRSRDMVFKRLAPRQSANDKQGTFNG